MGSKYTYIILEALVWNEQFFPRDLDKMDFELGQEGTKLYKGPSEKLSDLWYSWVISLKIGYFIEIELFFRRIILAKDHLDKQRRGKNQDQQYKITLKIEGKADRTAKVNQFCRWSAVRYSWPCRVPSTAFFQAISVNSLRWGIRGERAGNA